MYKDDLAMHRLKKGRFKTKGRFQMARMKRAKGPRAIIATQTSIREGRGKVMHVSQFLTIMGDNLVISKAAPKRTSEYNAPKTTRVRLQAVESYECVRMI
jgi:hypothetical protein